MSKMFLAAVTVPDHTGELKNIESSTPLATLNLSTDGLHLRRWVMTPDTCQQQQKETKKTPHPWLHTHYYCPLSPHTSKNFLRQTGASGN